MASVDSTGKKLAVVFGYHNVGVRCLSALISAGIDVRLVVTHEDDMNENVWFESVGSLARQHNIRVICPENPNSTEVILELRAASPDIIFSFYYRKILKPEILAIPSLGCYNMHGSLLPKYRGRAPVNWAILHGEKETGVTLHRMVAKVDAGAIADQMAVPILSNDTANDVFQKVVVAAEIVILRTLPSLLSGEARLQKMNIQEGSYFSGRNEEDGRIDVWKPARQIHDLIRAVSQPYPGAFIDLEQGRLKIWKTSVADTMSDGLPALFLIEGKITLRAGDGACLTVLECTLNDTSMNNLQAFLGTAHVTLQHLGSDPPGDTKLYLATGLNDGAAVTAILALPHPKADLLNYREPTKGWTPLVLACIKGLTQIAQVLLAAGADQTVLDSAGWTAKEHAVFRGYLDLAACFATQNDVPEARLKPERLDPVEHTRQGTKSQLFIYLGPSHTRSTLVPVDLQTEYLHDYERTTPLADLNVFITAQKASHESTLSVQLPMMESMVNTPVLFSADDPDSVILRFEICSRPSTVNYHTALGVATATLKGLREGQKSGYESIIRHHTIPIIHNGTMLCMGTLTFNMLAVTPFHTRIASPKPLLGFWEQRRPFPVVGHRGSGANSSGRNILQIGENTLQSFLTATDRGVSCVEFDVQLTKDLCPVIYHDFLVKETGGNIPLHALTLDQFRHLSRSQRPESDQVSIAEERYLETTYTNRDDRPKPRRHSLNQYDHHRSRDLNDRIKYTAEGLRGEVKGNLRGSAIQEPSTTLEQLLTSLPKEIAFDLEIKYPMLWEAEDRGMDFIAIELNVYVDTILNILFQHCGSRNITLSSFSPEVCIALSCKQNTFSILMINKVGTVPVSDIRAGSLKAAIDFATAWSLEGIVVKADPFIMCPRLLNYAKDMGFVVVSYGELNNDPKCALIQVEAGLDAIITDKAHLIGPSLAHV